MPDIAPCLWFDGKAEEAANLYVSLFPNSRIESVLRLYADTPSSKAGDVVLVSFTLDGRPFQALNGGPAYKFTEAISLSVPCADQAEVDRLWSALTADGGREVQCGWLKDKYGLSWQIVPTALTRLLTESDPATAKRVTEAMMEMVKLDVAALEEAARG